MTYQKPQKPTPLLSTQYALDSRSAAQWHALRWVMAKTKAGKNKQGEGSFTVLPDGRVRWRVHVTTQAGERRPMSGTAKNMTAARKAVADVRREAERNALAPRERYTLGQLVQEYIDRQAPRLKQRTVENYRALLRRNIEPSAGQLLAQGVTPARLRAFYEGLRETGQGDSVRRQVHNLINAAYKMGLVDNLVSVNPAAQTRPQYTQGSAKREKAFTPDEAARFYEVARADRWGWPLAFMLATGLRPGETLGLTWDNVTFNADGSASVQVERTRSVSGGKVYEDTPKTERGRRVLRVTGDAVALLRDSQAQQVRESRARLRFNGHEYIPTNYTFTTQAGTPWRPDNLRRPMRRLCLAAGVPIRTPHGLRHTFTSVMAASGHAVEVLSKQLGHATPTFTLEFYRSVFESERQALTYSPTPRPKPQAQVRRVQVKVRRAKVKLHGPTAKALPKKKVLKPKGS